MPISHKNSLFFGFVCLFSATLFAQEDCTPKADRPDHKRVEERPNRFSTIGAVDLKQPAAAAAVSPDGKLLVTATPETAELVFWDATTGKRRSSVKLDMPPISGLKFTPNGKHLACRATTYERTEGVVVWDVAAGRIAWKLLKSAGPGGYPSCAADDSPDGRYLAVGDERGRVHIWDFAAGKIARICEGPTGYVRNVVFSPDGSRVCANNDGGEVTLWDTATGRKTASRKFTGDHVSGIGFLQDGTAVVDIQRRQSGKHEILDLLTSDPSEKVAQPERFLEHIAIRPKIRFDNSIWPVPFEPLSPDGRLAIVTVAGPCFGGLLVLMPDDPDKWVGIGGDLFDMAQSGFTPDGRFAWAVIAEESKGHSEREYSLAFWKTPTGTPAGRICPPGGIAAYVAWSKDGKTAVLIGQKTTWLWRQVTLPLK